MSTRPVRDALRAAAAAYQPDRKAILERIQQGQASLHTSRASRPPRRRTATRMAWVVTTVLTVLGLGMAVTWAAVGNPGTGQTSHLESTVAPAPTDSLGVAGGHGAATRRPEASHASSSPVASASHTSSSPVASASNTHFQDGFLWSGGAIDPHSIDNWTQSNVTLRTSDTVTALDVRVRIATTPYLMNTGAWSTIPAEDLVTTVAQQPDALVYQFTLKPGVRLAPGSYLFAVQYNHAVGGRDPSRDSYQAVATAGGTQVDVYGGF